jgi:predicted nucleic acid-binding protein
MLPERFHDRDTGVVHEDVYPPEPFERRRHDRIHLRRVRDIRLNGECLPPQCGHSGRGTLRARQIDISTITVAEVVAGPLKAGNEILAAQYCEALRGSKNWEIIPVTEEIAILAARIRAIRNLRLPDAIQVATAVATGSLALVTHDIDFSKVQEIKIIS